MLYGEKCPEFLKIYTIPRQNSALFMAKSRLMQEKDKTWIFICPSKVFWKVLRKTFSIDFSIFLDQEMNYKDFFQTF